jgi:hypothetical protein
MYDAGQHAKHFKFLEVLVSEDLAATATGLRGKQPPTPYLRVLSTCLTTTLNTHSGREKQFQHMFFRKTKIN